MPPATRSRSSPLRLVGAGVVAIPVGFVMIGLFPPGSRLVPFVVSMAVVGGLAITGGWRARQALGDGTIATGRGIAIAVAGLTIGVVAALTALSGLASLL